MHFKTAVNVSKIDGSVENTYGGCISRLINSVLRPSNMFLSMMCSRRGVDILPCCF